MTRFPKATWLIAGALAVACASAAIFLLIRDRFSLTNGPTPGTVKMVTWLRERRLEESRQSAIIEEETPSDPWQINRPALIPVLIQAVADAKTLQLAINMRYRLASEYVWDGRNQEALQVCKDIAEVVDKAGQQLNPGQIAAILAGERQLEAISYFRMAEQDNCVCGHNADSCLFPIQGGGVHTRKEGSRGAVEVLTRSLTAEPRDLGARWLLNLAYMTLGEYPEGVPVRWLIPPKAFESDRDMGRFRDTAAERGVDAFGLAGGCALEDFDGDGRLDIFISRWSLGEQARYFWNRGDGRFEDRTEQAGILGEVGGLNLCHTDYDNDGHPDVLILRGGWLGHRGSYPPSLLRNRGNGTFDDVTEAAGLLSYHPGQVGVWADFDNDGWVDLFLGHEDDRNGRHPSQLYHNNRDGTFTDCTAACGLSNLRFVKGAAWGDVDNDGLAELYVSRMGEKNLLFKNEGPVSPGTPQTGSGFAWKFRDATQAAGVAEPQYSFSSWFFDYDNDGWLDLFVAGFKKIPVGDIAASYLGQRPSAGLPKLYRNNRNGTFTDVTSAAKLDRVLLVMGANFGDLDNDGYPDMYLGTGEPELGALMPNRMFHNAGGKYFEDITTSGGFGHLQKGHGIAFGDFDGDGDQDIYAVLGGWYTSDTFRNSLFENPGHGNRWITLKLQGVRTNRAAVGARIKVTILENGARREIHAVGGTGGSFGSSSLQQEIGLGKAEAIESIEVLWPATGKTQVLKNVQTNQVLEIREAN